MSLNGAEIQAVLDELDIKGSFLQNIRQPDYTHILFDFYNREGAFSVVVALVPGQMRIHRTSGKYPSLPKPPRFTQFLRSRIKSGKVEYSGQIGLERVVQWDIRRGGELFRLYIRLWGGSANLFLTTEQNIILDAFSRRPQKGEEPGGIFDPADIPRRDVPLQIEDYPGEGDLNSRLDLFFSQQEIQDQTGQLRSRLDREFRQQEKRLLKTLDNLEKRLNDQDDHEKWKVFGDLLLSQGHEISAGSDQCELLDYTTGQKVIIKLDTSLSVHENAQKYYKKSRKARTGKELTEQEYFNKKQQLEDLRRKWTEALQENDPDILKSLFPAKEKKPSRQESDLPGLRFRSAEFEILVGRTSKENDALLRRYVKGNDLWLHTRDYPGGYVFIKSIRGKSIPLPVLLDAGQLALQFSKAKNNGEADLFYTQVKYLRRAKDAPRGTVLPTQEKNLHVRKEEERLAELLGKKIK